MPIPNSKNGATPKKPSFSSKPKGSVKRNSSLLNFFQKTDGPPQATSKQSRITQFATKSERSPSSGNSTPGLRRESSSKSGDTAGGLFLDDKNGKGSLFEETGASTRSERARSKTPDDIWGEDAEEEEEDGPGGARYNEKEAAVKKRKVDSPLDDSDGKIASNGTDATPAPAPRKARQVSGPFIDESDSEDDIGGFGDLNEEILDSKPDTTKNEEQPLDKIDDNSADSQPASPVVPPLVREATSHVADEYTNFDDIEDEFRGEDEIIDLEDDLGETDADEAADFDDLNDSTGLEECNTISGGEVPMCPICQARLPGLSEAVSLVSSFLYHVRILIWLRTCRYT